MIVILLAFKPPGYETSEVVSRCLTDNYGRATCPRSLRSGLNFELDSNLRPSGHKAQVIPPTPLRLYSGVTRVKGQPGQLTNKQLSRRRAKRSFVEGGAAHRNP